MSPIRRQLPVASPITGSILLRAIADTTFRRDLHPRVGSAIAEQFDAQDVVLTDSGTAALVLALRLSAGPTRTVAMPAYACVDLIAAARKADVRVRLYDVDPHTLSADIDSLSRVAAAGVDAIVVAHLFGFPVDVPAVRAVVERFGAILIEDAAQHSGATLHGVPAGAMGDLVVLSFGRGKGTTSGRGGALLFRVSTLLRSRRDAAAALDTAFGLSDVVVAGASWLLGRPSVYGIPSALPGLHLGETVYHDAPEPRAMSRAAVAMLSRTLPMMKDAVAIRRRNGRTLHTATEQSKNLRRFTPVEGGDPGYLRFPAILRGNLRIASELGVARGYPRALVLEPQIQPILQKSGEPLNGAHDLARRLVTLPTHHMVTGSDLTRLAAWLHDK